jgi:hypothetical protein
MGIKTFKTLTECTAYLDSPEGIVENSSAILVGVQKAFKGNKKSAPFLEIFIEDAAAEVTISLTRSQWQPALEKSLEYFQKYEMSDESIDAYLLLKEIKAANFD